MKVLFTNPPWWPDQAPQFADGRLYHAAGVRAGSRWPFTMAVPFAPDHFEFGSYLPYPFFMGYASTWLAAKTSADVTFRDSIALRESYDAYLRFLDSTRYDYIFIESATPSWNHDRSLIQTIAHRYPGTRIVVCGPISSLGEQLFNEAPLHAVIQGEYEKGSVRVVQGEQGLIGHDLLTVAEMNASPHPYFDALHAHRYWDGNPIGCVPPQGHVWSSRGCPFKCIFCVWPATMTGNDPDGSGKRVVRHYSADYMEDFLRELVARYGFKTLYFDDDTFNLGDKHVREMCEVMRRIGVPWSAMCRADSSSMELWREMKDSGCFGVKLGFESGNQYVVDHIVNKRLDLEKARQAAMEIKRTGMTLHGTFTFGLPGETREQMDDTRRYIASIPFDSVQHSGCAEIEGTPLHTLASGGEIRNYDGATIDPTYIRESDGASKLRRMISIFSDRSRG
ncbi:B12-binding domain-containing radical SAM protein [Herbaspirillum rubrisubalbicans]|uniref:Radical SAM protein n=1 Tax=Herbaspirillum rubrisubalbicans TaxID=80842 RepID=A0AAD0UDP0_9BURK|nr:radical SAM protein [Herbaspirillum rubrisubalbicans]AYR26926.1 radical SAM protein [Herbaspirillum rubrisubalbicans]